MSYSKWITRPSSVVRDEFFVQYMLDNGLKEFITIPIDKSKSDYFLEPESYNNLIKYLSKNILIHGEKHLIQYNIIKKGILEAAKEVVESLDKDDEIIFQKYENYFDFRRKLGPYLFFPFCLPELEKEIKERYPDDFGTITSLGQPTEYHLFQQSISSDDVKTVVSKFGWLNVYSLVEPDYTEEDIINLKKQLNIKELEKSINAIKQNEVKFNQFIKTITNPKDIMICNLMHKYAFIRTDRIDVYKRSLWILKPFFEYISKLITGKNDLTLAIELFSDEIKKLLLNKIKPDLKELEDRKSKKGIFVYNKTKFEFIEDKERINKIKNKIILEKGKIESLKGTGASTGLIKARARVVKTDTDLKEFKKGEILVAPHTEPRHTIYMKISSGVITDEGGITCHAAIVSRELSLPCVIGVKNATDIIKTGDIIELNGKTGTIKIIKN